MITTERYNGRLKKKRFKQPFWYHPHGYDWDTVRHWRMLSLITERTIFGKHSTLSVIISTDLINEIILKCLTVSQKKKIMLFNAGVQTRCFLLLLVILWFGPFDLTKSRANLMETLPFQKNCAGAEREVCVCVREREREREREMEREREEGRGEREMEREREEGKGEREMERERERERGRERRERDGERERKGKERERGGEGGKEREREREREREGGRKEIMSSESPFSIGHWCGKSLIFLWNFHRRCLSTSSTPWFKRSQKWPKTQIKGVPALRCPQSKRKVRYTIMDPAGPIFKENSFDSDSSPSVSH